MERTYGVAQVDLQRRERNCVEVASADAVMIRDTRDRDGVTLAVPAPAWRAFTAGVRGNSGE